MPKIKSSNLNTDIQPAPVASADIIQQFIDLSSRFNEEDKSLMNNPPYQLTLSLQVLLSPARKNRKNKIKNKAEEKVPRPQNAWVLFRKDYEANQRMKFPDKSLKMKNVSTEAGEAWKKQSTNVKRYFEILSKLAHEQHKILYPNYKYTPKKKSCTKDWIFRDGGSSKQTDISTIVNDGSAATSQINDNAPQIASSSPEPWNSPIIISSNPNDLGLYFSSVTSILTYETLASSYFNYQQNVAVSNDNLVSNLNDLNLSNSDYETYQQLMHLANTCTNDAVSINNDIIDESPWQFPATNSDLQQQEQQSNNTLNYLMDDTFFENSYNNNNNNNNCFF